MAERPQNNGATTVGGRRTSRNSYSAHQKCQRGRREKDCSVPCEPPAFHLRMLFHFVSITNVFTLAAGHLLIETAYVLTNNA